MTVDYPYEILHSSGEKNSGKVAWKSPSNIAIVKYWGKQGQQIPKNTSLSLTLSNACTETYMSFVPKEDRKINVDFKFEGAENNAFKAKIVKYFDSISDVIPTLKEYQFTIESSNSFPHSSGIASSASAMSALALCICSMEAELFGLSHDENLREKASFLARLGSGSASRSVIPEVGLWGNHPAIQKSSDLHAVQVTDLHNVWSTYHDDILIVSAAEKSVSSTAGHALMNGNPYAESRYRQADSRISDLLHIMKSGDVEAFGILAEDEAMTLHALMMCSNPSYVLMEPGTLAMIREIRAFRTESKIPIYFTLDAGPNIHLLYPDSWKTQIQDFVNEKLLPLTVDGRIIKDQVGNGPRRIL